MDESISPSLIVLMIIDQYRHRIYQFKTGKRRGFQYYVQGQVKEISKNFALEIKKLEIVLKKQEVRDSSSGVVVVLVLGHFIG